MVVLSLISLHVTVHVIDNKSGVPNHWAEDQTMDRLVNLVSTALFFFSSLQKTNRVTCNVFFFSAGFYFSSLTAVHICGYCYLPGVLCSNVPVYRDAEDGRDVGCHGFEVLRVALEARFSQDQRFGYV